MDEIIAFLQNLNWSTIATFFASITALFIAVFQYKLTHRKKLTITYDYNNYVDKRNEISNKILYVHLINNGDIPIYIKTVSLKANNTKFTFVNNEITKKHNTYKIDLFEEKTESCVLDNIQNINKNCKLTLIITDFNNKKYKQKINKTIEDIFQDLEMRGSIEE